MRAKRPATSAPFRPQGRCGLYLAGYLLWAVDADALQQLTDPARRLRGGMTQAPPLASRLCATARSVDLGSWTLRTFSWQALGLADAELPLADGTVDRYDFERTR
jgi:hypothetical protein